MGKIRIKPWDGAEVEQSKSVAQVFAPLTIEKDMVIAEVETVISTFKTH